MIAKHVPMRSMGKSDFAGLVAYITDDQDKTQRLGHIEVTNCQSGSVSAAIEEVLATQLQNKRATGDKTYHLLVSFRPGENPSDAVLRAIETRICEGLGFAEHQRISAVHRDTDNVHIHIAINKIHPTRGTMSEPYKAYKALAELCSTLELQYGLQRDNHTPGRRVSEGRASDMEHHAGVDSLVGWIKRECVSEIKAVQSWQELHAVLQARGLEVREQGNGLVFKSLDGAVVKASTVDRELSKPRLIARLGKFEGPPEGVRAQQSKPTYTREPVRMRADTTELYARYKTSQAGLSAARGTALLHARQRRDRAIADAKRSNLLRRSALKIVDSKGINKRTLYAQASASLKRSLDAINKQYVKEKESQYAGFQRQAWADWLKSEALKGDAQALAALRSREAAQSRSGDSVQAAGQRSRTEGASRETDNITKKGTVIYRAGSGAVRDDGTRLQVSTKASEEVLREALRMAVERYGDRITVSGTPEFKAQIIRAAAASGMPITFADAALERRRKELLSKEKSSVTTTGTTTTDRGRIDRRSIGSVRSGAVADKHGTRSGHARPGPHGRVQRSAGQLRDKPDVGSVGRVPPPQSQNRLRRLSQLGVVRLASGSEVLLPGDVPGHLVKQGAEPNNALRRGVPGGGLSVEAAMKYIEEREGKRAKGFDIPKHTRYTGGSEASLFMGVRNVDGQALALLRRGDAIEVLPVDQATVIRLSRLAVGSPVTVTPRGSIKTKGRGM